MCPRTALHLRLGLGRGGKHDGDRQAERLFGGGLRVKLGREGGGQPLRQRRREQARGQVGAVQHEFHEQRAVVEGRFVEGARPGGGDDGGDCEGGASAENRRERERETKLSCADGAEHKRTVAQHALVQAHVGR